jgi:hypothetical protein
VRGQRCYVLVRELDAARQIQVSQSSAGPGQLGYARELPAAGEREALETVELGQQWESIRTEGATPREVEMRECRCEWAEKR